MIRIRIVERGEPISLLCADGYGVVGSPAPARGLYIQRDGSVEPPLYISAEMLELTVGGAALIDLVRGGRRRPPRQSRA